MNKKKERNAIDGNTHKAPETAAANETLDTLLPIDARLQFANGGRRAILEHCPSEAGLRA